MVRSIANVIFVVCLAAWSLLLILLSLTLFEDGPGAIKGKLIHVAGSTGELGVQSLNLVVWRLLGLLVITLFVAYVRRPKLQS
jgi:hypothetical protein